MAGKSKQSIFPKVAEAVALIAVPIVLIACTVMGFEGTAFLSMLVVLASLGLFFLGYEGSKPRLRDVMPTVVLAALACAGRILFAPFPSFKPVSAIAIIAGIVFGRKNGFMVGAIAALVSNFFFGQGAWTPWQMYAWGLLGYLAGALANTSLFKKPIAVYVFGFLSALLYGFILNVWSMIGFYHPQTFAQTLLLFSTAIPFDIVHGVSTVLFLLALYMPWKRKLYRIKAKYGL